MRSSFTPRQASSTTAARATVGAARNPATGSLPGTLGRRPVPDRPAPLRRSLRWLRRILIALLVLGVLGVAGFWWFAYSPFEGKIDRVDALVPADVDFVYRGSWAEIREKGWFQQHAIDAPVFPGLDRAIVDQPAFADLRKTEQQVNDGLPGALKVLEGLVFGTKEFRVEKDIVPGDVVAAGRWCSGGSPFSGPPEWRDLLLLTRVTPLVKFGFEALKHDFVRSRAMPPDAEADVTVTAEGWLRFESKNPALKPRGRRDGCEGGAERSPLDVWYVGRFKDVLAITNSEDLLKGVGAVDGGVGDRAINRPGFELPRAEGGIAAAVDLVGLRSYLNRYFATGDDSQKVGAFLGKFLAIDSLDRTSASVIPLPSGDGVLVRAQIAFSYDRLRAFKDVLATYELTPQTLADGIARIVPARDTVAIAQLTTPPRALFHALYDTMKRDDQRLIEDNVRDLGVQRRARGETGYANVGEFLDELANQLESNTGIAMARIPSVFDTVKYATWYSGDDPAPTAALAVMVGIPKGKSPDEVDKYLADRVGAMGFDPPERVTSPDGITYSRLHLALQGKYKIRDYELITPAFRSTDGRLILSTREEYLLEILRTMRAGAGAPPSVLQSRAFDAATRDLPSDATLAVYVDGDNLRKLAWDYRNEMVHSRHDDTEYAKAYKVRLILDTKKAGMQVDFPKIDDQVDKEMDRYRSEEYGKFIDEWRDGLDTWRRFSGAAVVFAARKRDSLLDGGASIVFTDH